jgi:pimeloyl-ACP methyl ester carboxylesterase
MSTGHVSTKDSVDIFFKDWGRGQPVVFSHGWPLNADAWDDAMMFVARNGFRASRTTVVVAAGRASHGMATTWTPMRTIFGR